VSSEVQGCNSVSCCWYGFSIWWMCTSSDGGECDL